MFPRDMVCIRNISVDTLHEGDTEDNNNSNNNNKPITIGATGTISESSSLSSHVWHGVGPLVDSFRSHVSRSLFKGLP